VSSMKNKIKTVLARPRRVIPWLCVFIGPPSM
jgi:hypothetical protein